MIKLITRRKSLILPAAAAISICAPAIIKHADAQFFNPPIFMPQAAGGGFNPTSLITGAGGFWRADMGVTTSGANVTSWADQSSFSQTLTHTNNPNWTSTNFNTSFPGVKVSGGNDYVSNSSFVFAPSSTGAIFALFTNNSSGTTFGRIMTMCPSDASNSDFNSTSALEMDQGNSVADVAGNIGNVAGNSYAGSFGTPVLGGWTWTGSVIQQYINGSTQGSSSAMTNNIGSNSATIYFALFNSSSHTGYGGATPTATIAFAGITQKAMSGADWTNLKTWSNSNWGTSF